MSKKLILGLALAVVLFSGTLFSAQADCGFGCLPHISLPSCWSCGFYTLRRIEIRTGQRLLARARITMARPYRVHLALEELTNFD